MAEIYREYRILADKSFSKETLKKDLTKTQPPSYTYPSSIPPRIVEVYDFLPTNINSRIATYLLTDEEAKTLREKDKRIIEILPLEDLQEEPASSQGASSFIRANSFEFSTELGSQNKLSVNWGLYSCTHLDIPLDSLPEIQNDQGEEIANWIEFDGPYDYTLDGTGVDLIVIDGAKIDPNHHDFLDSTGTNSRVQTINWGEYVGWDPNDFPTYLQDAIFTAEYHHYTSSEEIISTFASFPTNINHGTICLSIAGGRVHGWAKNATLYYIRTFDVSYEWDLVRAFHEQKPIDPKTGFKRPTIVNKSLGFAGTRPQNLTYEEGIFYSGSFYPNATPSLELGFPQITHPSKGRIGNRRAAVDQPLTEATDAGVIFIHSAMNEGHIFFRASPDSETPYPIPDRYRSIHFNNYLSSSAYEGSTSEVATNAPDYMGSIFDGKRYYHRGYSPTNLATVEVGALRRIPLYNSLLASQITNKESADWYSNHGGGIDIYAPTGVMCGKTRANLMGFSNPDEFYAHFPPPPPPNPPGVPPYLHITHGFTFSGTGTSFAAPQVAGVACLYFQMNPGADVWQFKQFLLDNAKPVRVAPSEDNDGPIDVWEDGNIKTEGGIDYIALNGAPTASLFWPYSSPNQINFSKDDTPPINPFTPPRTFNITTS